ncbi:hypothetical protein BU17DRAFT_83629 [Hysterangium stoloniferum]|nr:hypothetical protein BU17DRAFT_83629 [Hysterangium stoloniferum]
MLIVLPTTADREGVEENSHEEHQEDEKEMAGKPGATSPQTASSNGDLLVSRDMAGLFSLPPPALAAASLNPDSGSITSPMDPSLEDPGPKAPQGPLDPSNNRKRAATTPATEGRFEPRPVPARPLPVRALASHWDDESLYQLLSLEQIASDLIKVLAETLNSALHSSDEIASDALACITKLRDLPSHIQSPTIHWDLWPYSPDQIPRPIMDFLSKSMVDIRNSITSQLTRFEQRFDAHHAQSPRGLKHQPPATRLAPEAAGNTATSYAAVAAATPPSPQSRVPSPPGPRVQARRSPPSSEPLRYIVQFRGEPPPVTERQEALAISRNVNRALALVPTAKGLHVLGSHWNTSQNIILSFPPHTSAGLVEDHLPTIHLSLGLPPNTIISKDTPWSKITLTNVLTRSYPGEEVFSEETLLEEVMANPSLQSLKITQPPRFIRPADRIDGYKSSVVLAFEDADGSLLKTLLGTHTRLFIAPNAGPLDTHSSPANPPLLGAESAEGPTQRNHTVCNAQRAGQRTGQPHNHVPTPQSAEIARTDTLQMRLNVLNVGSLPAPQSLLTPPLPKTPTCLNESTAP